MLIKREDVKIIANKNVYRGGNVKLDNDRMLKWKAMKVKASKVR